jgi:hypothetical protein
MLFCLPSLMKCSTSSYRHHLRAVCGEGAGGGQVEDLLEGPPPEEVQRRGRQAHQRACARGHHHGVARLAQKGKKNDWMRNHRR